MKMVSTPVFLMKQLPPVIQFYLILMWLFLCLVYYSLLRHLCDSLHKHMETELGRIVVLEDLFLSGNPPLWGPAKVTTGHHSNTLFLFQEFEENKKKNKQAREKIFMSARKSRDRTHWDTRSKMWTLNMTCVSFLFLLIVLLVGWGQAAEDDVTPRLSFSYSKCTDTHMHSSLCPFTESV